MEGPPGTGKTSAARIIASQLGRPLVHLPLEVRAQSRDMPEIQPRSRPSLVHLPLEVRAQPRDMPEMQPRSRPPRGQAIVSKWFGESEQKLASVFDTCAKVMRAAIQKHNHSQHRACSYTDLVPLARA